MKRIAFYGSSLVSSYWNGAATYYRGIIKALHQLGYRTTFYEPDVYDRQQNRDMDPPDWCEVVVYPGTVEGVKSVTDRAAAADIVVKASGVAFAQAFNSLIADPGLRNRLAASAHRRSADFTLCAQSEAMWDLYCALALDTAAQGTM